MPTPYEAGLMSQLSYEFKKNYQDDYVDTMQFMAGEKGDLKKVFIKPYIPEGSRLDLIVDYLKKRGWKYLNAKKSDSWMGYQALVFINATRKEIVIAHRGTVLSEAEGSESNVKDDIEILKGENGEIPLLLSSALIFVSQTVRMQEEDYPDYIIHQTGHSLGGFFAECGAAYLENPSKNYPEPYEDKEVDDKLRLKSRRPHQANAITFDSLGSKNILQKIGINAQGSGIINYLPEPNIANTANLHLGKRILLLTSGNIDVLSVDQNKTQTWSGTKPLEVDKIFLQTIVSHPLANIITAFDSKNGQPINGKEIAQWPTATNNFVMSEFQHHAVPETESVLGALLIILAGGYVHYKSTGIAQWTHTRTGKIALAPAPTVMSAASTSSASSVQTLGTQSWIPGTGVASNTNNSVVKKTGIEKQQKQSDNKL